MKNTFKNVFPNVLIGLMIISITFFFISIAVSEGLKRNSSCTRVIFLTGELSRDIHRVDYLQHGNIARVYYCDGTSEEVSTSRIIKIVEK